MTTNDHNNNDLYIGWQERAPTRHARFLKRWVPLLVGMALAVSAVLVTTQEGFYPSVFEFGEVRTFEGMISEQPYPMLLVARPGGNASVSGYYLVGQGKHGAHAEVSGLDGQCVRFEGTLIYRDNQTMIEVVPGTAAVLDASCGAPSMQNVSLGTHTLVGEIVDSKCFFGVMNPGNLKIHKACATRCISGGIPPVLAVRDAEGRAAYFLLQGTDGRSINQEILDLIAVPVEITGEVERHGDLLVLRAEPDTFHQIAEHQLMQRRSALQFTRMH